MSTTTTNIITYKTRSTNENTHPMCRLTETLSKYIETHNRCDNYMKRCKYMHKIYIIINSNRHIIIHERGLAFAIYRCAIRNHMLIVVRSDNQKTSIYAKKQIDKYIAYFETYCLNSNTSITPEIFRYISSFVSI